MYSEEVLLVTGFEPFGPWSHNPSQALLDALPDSIEGLPLRKAVLPVDSQRLPEALRPLYREKPRGVIHLGLAAGRPLLSLERFAHNLLDFAEPDNQGHQPRETPILPGAPLALASRLPLRTIQEAWHTEGIPSALSTSAGTYLCNQAMYLALSWLPPETPAGFIHLPADETLAHAHPQAYIPLAIQTRAVLLALQRIAHDLT